MLQMQASDSDLTIQNGQEALIGNINRVFIISEGLYAYTECVNASNSFELKIRLQQLCSLVIKTHRKSRSAHEYFRIPPTGS